MKMTKKIATVLVMGYAAFASQTALAAWTTQPTAANVVAQEKTLTGKANAASIVFTTTANLVANDTIRLDVVGAKFDKTTAATLTPTKAGTASGAVGVLAASNAGAVGQTSATWRVTTAIPSGTLLTFNTAAAITDLTGIVAGNKVSYKITITSTGSNVKLDATPASTNTAFTGVDLLTVTNTAAAATADVTTSYKKFTATSGTGGTDTLSDTSKLSAIASAAGTAAVAVGSAVITLAGDFSGISSVTSAGVIGFDGTANKVTGEYFINAAKTSAVARNKTAIANDGATAQNFSPKYIIDGVTAQTARNITASIALSGDATYSNYTPLADTKNLAITRDGFSFQTLLAGTSSANKIIIRDLSGNLATTGGAINVSVRWFDLVTGASAGTASGVMTTRLQSNGQVVTTASKILTEIGAVAPTTPTYATFDFAVETSKGAAANKKAVAGVGLDSTVTSQASGTAL